MSPPGSNEPFPHVITETVFLNLGLVTVACLLDYRSQKRTFIIDMPTFLHSPGLIHHHFLDFVSRICGLCCFLSMFFTGAPCTLSVDVLPAHTPTTLQHFLAKPFISLKWLKFPISLRTKLECQWVLHVSQASPLRPSYIKVPVSLILFQKIFFPFKGICICISCSENCPYKFI